MARRGGRHQLRFFSQIAHRENNQLLHTSAQALNEMVTSWDQEEAGFRIGPSEANVDRALLAAYWVYGQTSGELVKHFKLGDYDEFRGRFLDFERFRG